MVDPKYRQRLTTARRELRKAVDRFAEIPDPLRGHRVEAVRQARAIRDAADELIEAVQR